MVFLGFATFDILYLTLIGGYSLSGYHMPHIGNLLSE